MTAPKTRTHPDPFLWQIVGLAIVFGATLPLLIALTRAIEPEPPEPQPHPWAEAAMRTGGDPDEILLGESTYYNTCAVCHGRNAEGLVPLGKPLRNSAFVQGQNDESLFTLIAEGRAPSDPENTTGALMPSRGAQGIGSEQIRAVIAYLRAIQEPGEPTVAMDAWILDEEHRRTGVAIELTEHPGYNKFVASCAACHGQGGGGMENFGLPLTTSGFIKSKTDQELINFIKTGRPMWDENNVTGLDMPPKGGNPAITEADLQDIVAYIRALQKAALDAG